MGKADFETPRSEVEAQEIVQAQEAYSQAFRDAVATRIPLQINSRAIVESMQNADFQVSLQVDIDANEPQIELPEHIQAVVDSAFKGFTVNRRTQHPLVRVKSIAFLPNGAAIDVEPTILTPKREGLEGRFIGFPDGTKAVYERLNFNIIKGRDYVVGHGNPDGQSMWVTQQRVALFPLNGERNQLTPDAIRDLASLVSVVNEMPHSDFRTHRKHH